MMQKNNGQESAHMIQNQFTAYLLAAIHRKKSTYLHKKIQHFQEISCEELDYFQSHPFVPDVAETLPLFIQLENDALLAALKQLKNRERYIFLARVLDDKSFKELAVQLGMGYKGVAAIYYRVIQKIKTKMKEVADAF